MNEKKEKIIQAAMKLFSEKGYHATSIQEVADRSGVSKGAVYLHFTSKDDMILSIFKYYYETMKHHILINEETDNLSPKESFIKQLQIYFTETIHYKDFIRMQFREQALSFHKDIKQIMMNIHKETHEWYERNLLKIYGDEIRPYLYDATLIVEGILHAYLRMVIINKINMDIQRLSRFIFERSNDVMIAMMAKKETPMITLDHIGSIYSPVLQENDIAKTEKDLIDIRELVKGISNIEIDKRQVLETVDFLLKSIKEDNMKEFILKGMLNNLKEIHELKPIVDKIAIRHGIK